jgi:hypothetical protein
MDKAALSAAVVAIKAQLEIIEVEIAKEPAV